MMRLKVVKLCTKCALETDPEGSVKDKERKAMAEHLRCYVAQGRRSNWAVPTISAEAYSRDKCAACQSTRPGARLERGLIIDEGE